MILVVALNPALDVTYEVERFRVGGTNRVLGTRTRAGGKPLNVARVLGALGVETVVVGFGAGALAEQFEHDSAGLPVSVVWVPLSDGGGTAPARRTVAVVDRRSHEVTAVNEPGQVASGDCWERLCTEVRSRLSEAQAVVLTGSVPPGLPVDSYAVLVWAARDAGCWVALDTDEPWLSPALAAGPDLVKPNADELARAGLVEAPPSPAGGADEALRAATELRRDVRDAVVVSLGEDGLVAATEGGSWIVRPPLVTGNATGAGDATLAGLVAGRVRGWEWPERLRRAAALGAAAAAEPVAGELQLAKYRDLLAATTRVTKHESQES